VAWSLLFATASKMVKCSNCADVDTSRAATTTQSYDEIRKATSYLPICLMLAGEPTTMQLLFADVDHFYLLEFNLMFKVDIPIWYSHDCSHVPFGTEFEPVWILLSTFCCSQRKCLMRCSTWMQPVLVSC
jgi:hypothetical protein